MRPTRMSEPTAPLLAVADEAPRVAPVDRGHVDLGVQTLRQMFPFHEANFLERTLIAHDGRLDDAALALVGQEEASDQLIACALLHEMASQWTMEKPGRTIPEDVRHDPGKLEAFLRGQLKGEILPSAQRTLDVMPHIASAVHRLKGGVAGFLARISSPAPITRVLPMQTVLLEPLCSDARGRGASSV